MKKYICMMIALCCGMLAGAQPSKDSPPDLEQRFAHPPAEAKPWVYWFWMNGNVTKEGITADLEAMNRIGIGGALMMGVGLGTPPGDVDFNSPLYREMYAHAAKECVRLGMKLTLHQCDGWATAGGPWITPDRSMKMLVWTTKEIAGPVSGPVKLDQPLTKENFYEEVSLLAVPLGAKTALSAPVATVDGKPAPALTDGNYAKGQKIGKQTELRFDAPRTVSTLVFQLPDYKHGMGANTPAMIEVSADGESFRQAAMIDLGASLDGRDRESMTVSFAPETARAVRILINNPPPSEVDEIEVLAEPRVNLWEVKSGWARKREHGGETKWLDAAPTPPDIAGIDLNQIIDLSGKLSADGTLDWVPPAGRWLIVRAGMTSTAKHVAPRTNAGEGLEADKMSGEAIRFHFDSFAKGMIADNNAAKGNPVYSVHTDSWESNIHTWSSHFREEFEKRRGYSMTKWMPVLTSGLVIGSAGESDRFLWDVRRTMADLIRDNFYGEMRRMCHENGVLFQSEAAGRQMFMYDPINYNSMTDISVGEFWMPNAVRTDCKVAASVSHIYNRPIAAAESFTSGNGGFNDDPFALKVLGDQAFCTGINRYIIHRYCMQPFSNVEPGMTFGPWGINFERTQTWWENGGKAWVGYVTRCQSLLQSGRFVADVIHYIGDDAPNSLGHREDVWSPVPAGYDFDGCNLEILKQLSVDKNGNLVLPHGMSYRVLLLPDRDHMALEAVQKIEALVKDGATVIGLKPLRTPGLKDAAKNDAALREIAGRVWGKIDGKTVTENRCGKGRMIYGPSLETVLAGIAPADFDYSTDKKDSTLRYIHRKTDKADFYFVASADSGSALDATVRFRVTGKAPELWDASTGRIVKPAVYRVVNGVTELPMHFDPAGSVFVVFREPSNPQALVSVSCDGQSLFPKEKIQTLEAQIETNAADNFTMALWLKSDAEMQIPEEGLNVKPGGWNFAVYPAPGHEIFGEPDLGIGIAAGRNGLVVLAHGSRLFATVSAYEGDLSQWTHVAVVFRDRVPQLYVNGKPVKAGKAFSRPVHPSIGVKSKRSVVAFNGETAGWAQRAGALEAAAVAAVMNQTRPAGTKQSAGVPDVVFNGTALDVRAGAPGVYQARNAAGQNAALTAAEPVQLDLAGPWDISFPPGKQAPAGITLPQLISWSESTDDGVKYFSGTATYRTEFDWKPDAGETVLNLGTVKNVAEVSLNGQPLGTLWKPPYQVDVTGVLKPGKNNLEIKVTNLWPNRLIGDEKLHPDPSLDYSRQCPAWSAGGPIKTIPKWVKTGGISPVGRTTFLLWKFYGGSEPLLESGLLGPVTLIISR
ncbi:MAG: glycosyl hydrolase [Kiritimatiellales bacterium]|jgi:hypothetical protein